MSTSRINKMLTRIRRMFRTGGTQPQTAHGRTKADATALSFLGSPVSRQQNRYYKRIFHGGKAISPPRRLRLSGPPDTKTRLLTDAFPSNPRLDSSKTPFVDGGPDNLY